MELDTLTAISPVDGRYRGKTSGLDRFFSEFALIRYRVKVEVEYFIALCQSGVEQLGDVPAGTADALRAIYENFTEDDARRIKEHESVTNHDVKAVEYFLKERFDALGLEKWKESHPFRPYLAGYKQHISADVGEGCPPRGVPAAARRAYRRS